MYRVRFNLARGEHFMHWQVMDMKRGEIDYYDPEQVCIAMYKCVLKNQKGTAQKIHAGANKSVCAWVECSFVLTRHKSLEMCTCDCLSFPLQYNPRVAPHWVGLGSNIDGFYFDRLVTESNKIFLPDFGSSFLDLKTTTNEPTTSRQVRKPRQQQDRPNVRRRRPNSARHDPSQLLA